VIIDEADRLKTSGLEQLRDFFDRHDLGLILIGMPGFDRPLARYPHLYSRICFAHQCKPLDAEDLPLVVTNYWHQLGLLLDPGDPNDIETISTVIRITGGNFRLMTQVARVIGINQTQHPAVPPCRGSPRTPSPAASGTSSKHRRAVPVGAAAG